MINKERVQLLVDALRSGEYKQGNGQLRTSDDNFCCLGVACDIYIKETNQGEWDGVEFVSEDETVKFYLSKSVKEWFGFNVPNPSMIGGCSLGSYNDLGYDFNFIADKIDEEFLKSEKDNA